MDNSYKLEKKEFSPKHDFSAPLVNTFSIKLSFEEFGSIVTKIFEIKDLRFKWKTEQKRFSDFGYEPILQLDTNWSELHEKSEILLALVTSFPDMDGISSLEELFHSHSLKTSVDRINRELTDKLEEIHEFFSKNSLLQQEAISKNFDLNVICEEISAALTKVNEIENVALIEMSGLKNELSTLSEARKILQTLSLKKNS